jgi:molybdenum cofactor biosynthesis protein B
MAHPHPTSKEFFPVNIAVLTVSDTRTEDTDTSGKTLQDRLLTEGHRLADKKILADNKYLIRAQVSQWIADEGVDAVLITGGTGLTGRDITPEAVEPLLDKRIDGFGELFRYVSYEEISTSTLQSRALGGIANGTFIFCLPGSTGACRTAWDKILKHQLNLQQGPCNFVQLMPRTREL